MNIPPVPSTPQNTPDHGRATAHRLAVGRTDAPRRMASSELLGQQRVLEIDHDGCIYLLRLTASGKLILTK